ncbi:MAG TPA: TlpA disulfide reductase family protein [Nitrospiraceae bacterium]|nr:TlpA disulfide reductase family protein [Nitrospiraceae bacterium]
MSGRVGGRRLIVACLALVLACAAGIAVAADDFARLKLSRAGAGTPLPAFTLTTVEGKALDFSQLRGKVVVLNFWATWCGPCKEEMPALDRLSRRFDPRDVAILTITTEHERTNLQQFMKQLDSTLPVLLDEQRDVSLAFMVRGLPTTVVVAKNGTIVARAVGPREWDGPDAIRFIERLREETP